MTDIKIKPSDAWAWLGVLFALLSMALNVWLVYEAVRAPDLPLLPPAKEATR